MIGSMLTVSETVVLRKIVGFCLDFPHSSRSILANLLFGICFELLKVPIAVEFPNTFVVCGIFRSLSLGAIWREDAIVYVLSLDKGMLNSISFFI